MQDLTAIEAEPTAHRTRRWTWAATARTLASLLLISLVLFLGFVAYGTVVNNRWYTIVAIEGGSMQPTINQGDAIVITRPPATIEEGMILTMSIEGHIVTHRVVTVNPDGSLVTKGDANDAVDEWSGFEVRVIGRYRGRIPLLGRTLPDRSGAWLLDRVEIYFSADPAPAAVPPTDPKHGIDVSRVTSTGSAPPGSPKAATPQPTTNTVPAVSYPEARWQPSWHGPSGFPQSPSRTEPPRGSSDLEPLRSKLQYVRATAVAASDPAAVLVLHGDQ